MPRQRQCFARVGGLINGGRQFDRRVAALVMPPGQQSEHEEHDCRGRHKAGDAHPPIQFGEQIHQVIEDGFGLLHQGRRFAEFLRAAQLGIERGHDLRHVELELGRVIPDKAADIHRRGENVVVSLFERADMVGADFGGVRDLLDRQIFGFAPGAELFGDRWHSPYLAPLTRHWQSCTATA